MKWAERLKNSYRKGHHSDSDGYSSSDHSSYYENSTDGKLQNTVSFFEETTRREVADFVSFQRDTLIFISDDNQYFERYLRNSRNL